VMHVPLIFAGPGIRSGLRVRPRAGLVDVAPTLLELAGAPPLAGAHGRSLVAALRGETLAERPIIAEVQGAFGTRLGPPTSNLRAVWLNDMKIIHDVTHDAWYLYDLAQDPREVHPRTDPEVLASLKEQLVWYETL